MTCHFRFQVFDFFSIGIFSDAPWCGHCKALAPEYAAAATKLAADGSSLLLGKVDATEEADLAEKFDIRGYPTLKFFNKGKVVEYSGGRTSESIIKWLNKKTGPPATDLTAADDATKFSESQKVVVVAYYASKDSDNAKTFLEVAAGNDEVPFGIISDEAVAKALDIKEEGVTLFKQFDEKRAAFAEEFTVENLKKFISANSLPLVVEFSHETASKIFGGEIKTHNLLFVNYKSDDYTKNIDSYRKVAGEFKGKVLFVTINTEEAEHAKIMEFFGLKADEAPAMRLIRLEEEMTKYKPEKLDFSEDAVRSFVQGVIDGTIKQHLLSQDLPEDWDKEPVKVLVSSNFDEVAMDKNKDVLVEFYAPWCGHCKSLAPIYTQLAEKFADNDKIVIAKMDSTANELEHTKINSFPTLKLYKRETNEVCHIFSLYCTLILIISLSWQVIEYNGERTLDGLSKFMESGGDYGRAAPEEVMFSF